MTFTIDQQTIIVLATLVVQAVVLATAKTLPKKQ